MMLSPMEYYEQHLKGKSAEEIKKGSINTFV